MEAQAHEQAGQATAKARRSLDRLRIAKDGAELTDAWQDFLNAADRVFEKLKAGANDNGKARAWYGRIEHEQRTDQLLSYVQHARNADHHRFEEIAKFRRGGLGIGGPGTGITIINEISFGGDGRPAREDWFQIGGTRPGVRFDPPYLRPLPVIDRGVTYAVPTRHFDHQLESQSVVEIAELMQAYLDSLVVAASHFLAAEDGA